MKIITKKTPSEQLGKWHIPYVVLVVMPFLIVPFLLIALVLSDVIGNLIGPIIIITLILYEVISALIMATYSLWHYGKRSKKEKERVKKIITKKFATLVKSLKTQQIEREAKILEKIKIENQKSVDQGHYMMSKGQFDDALEMFEKSKQMCLKQGWKDGIIYANNMILECENKNQEKFENLMLKAKQLNEEGKIDHNKQSFTESIKIWEEAIHVYDRALDKAPSLKEREKISDYKRVLNENICYSYIESGKKNNRLATDNHKEKNIQKARELWNRALNDFRNVINLIKSNSFDISIEQLHSRIEIIEINLNQLQIEELYLKADLELETAKKLAETDIRQAIIHANNSILQYNDTITHAKDNNLNELLSRIQNKREGAQNFVSTLHDKFDDMYIIETIVPDAIDKEQGGKVKSIIKPLDRKYFISTLREYEFIGGQVRFKLKISNNTNYPMTDFIVTFEIPDALKWIAHEPKYERKGDSIFIPKLGKNDKKSVALYLEPISCTESPINATVSFHDAKDVPRALRMKPKTISISCPLYFTEEEVNLARTKSLRENLTHHDKKTIPIVNPDNLVATFESVVDTFGTRDIKLVSKSFSAKDKYGEAWFYGTTKAGKKGHVMRITIDGNRRLLELECSGDEKDQITGFLADIGREARERLLNENLISSEDQFFDMRVSIALHLCPYCLEEIPHKLAEKFTDGKSIKCNICGTNIDFI